MQFTEKNAVFQAVREWMSRQEKAFLKRASGCFQNIGKNVLTPEGQHEGYFGTALVILSRSQASTPGGDRLIHDDRVGVCRYHIHGGSLVGLGFEPGASSSEVEALTLGYRGPQTG
ncbi:hypothetical protein AVEN_225247-1 [Araneus ventricosus]|uniref:Uncharacterized protein n=1 Tax=Araneus ventricosus TaxID=182803 RepID=A0A4Y2AL65_ARAVE|nr:hypothetical protein AVEN_225247-1 [Araneus ventricosus]